jgi:predicted small lipoprotein YifL
MMRRTLTLAPLLLLAACGGSGPAPLPVDQVTATFPPHGIANVIVIDATDRLPLRAATLIAPDGSTIPADGIDVNARPRSNYTLGTRTDPTHSGMGDVIQTGPPPIPSVQSEGQLLTTISNASITLPDPVAYRRDWQQYRIRLDFGTPPGAVETQEIAAPEPPAAG